MRNKISSVAHPGYNMIDFFPFHPTRSIADDNGEIKLFRMIFYTTVGQEAG